MLLLPDTKLFTYDTVAGDGWMPFADFDETGLSDISRIAVSPDGTSMIVVGESD